MSRWERLFESKPVPLIDQLLSEVAKLIANDLRSWPLPLDELDPQRDGAFASILKERRPDHAVFAEAFRVAQWELGREIEAVDEYMRNRRWMDHGLRPGDQHRILLVSRWLLEQLLSLQECTHSRLTRGHLVDCLQRARQLFLEFRPPMAPAPELVKI